MTDPLAWLDETARARRAAGLRRTLSPREVVEPLVDLASNDYLGLARDPRVVEGAVAATRTWGAGSTGSRLVTGSTRLHAELEEALAAFGGAEAGLVFSSGYTANLGAVTALSGRGALVVSDVAAHASLVDAARLSRARVVVSRCSVPADVDAVLAAAPETRRLVVTDGVDSVDGGLAPLRELAAVCRARGAVLLVDDAHGLGVRGPASAPGAGLVAEVGLAGERGVVVTATLSKSLGSQGGVVLGDADVVAHLVDAARSFIFDTGLAPAAAGAALAALHVLREEPERVAALHAAAVAVASSARSAAPWAGVAAPTAAMVPVVLGEPELATAARDACATAGLRAGCFRPPSVPEGTSRLRLTARADLSTADLALVDRVLAEVLPGVRGTVLSR
ncbi:8-amino-7-oxononanoate synthase [Actinomycetospora sp. TBRC 11914]|uniref:8-amino-7-oxononanoate synthase n=1 Tax=Actinomycetospora sp. TBRC 11914 TaxID=2729387 RepID=UPI00145DA47A|nr:8-amino-7-oxononanoate synthase [Actinomycetospora sp. TBRC 11914]NMO93281.1 8-amino-7-oxononanoate synthase [Actinomycetospora sp. TBRC 11914]